MVVYIVVLWPVVNVVLSSESNCSHLTINNVDLWLMYIRCMLFHLLLDATTNLLRYIRHTKQGSYLTRSTTPPTDAHCT